jgi:hypothetical protein
MSDQASASDSVAQALWLRFAGRNEPLDREHVLAAADRLLGALDLDLRRWVGAEGYGAVLRRATVIAEMRHPALRHVPDLVIEASPARNGRVHPAAEIAEGMVDLVATLIELLGRIIGSELAVRLVEHVGVLSPRGTVSTPIRNDTDD